MRPVAHHVTTCDFRATLLQRLVVRACAAYIAPQHQAAMIASLRKLFSAAPARALPAVPPGERVYAIGDIHGRRDLLEAMATEIERDDAQRPPAQTTVVLLGDLVDRGPESAGVIAKARAWQVASPPARTIRIIAGNHEEMFLESFGKTEVLRSFLRHGGRETLLSYPIDPEDYARADLAETRALMVRAVPDADLAFLRGLEDRIVIGDYLFVHAGIRPGVAAADQTTSDLRWIREPFLGHGGDHGHVVVHGHTITETAEIRPNRIGIDTGAFASGKLTALCLEGTARRLIEVCESDGHIAASVRRV